LAIGARVTVRTGGVKQFSEVKGGSSYLSQNDLRQHFGLGSNKNMDEVAVRWPSGQTETFKNVPADFIYTIVEDQGIKAKIPLPQVDSGAPPAEARGRSARIDDAKVPHP
ncbi:MAG TPA: ASPIC/UnbV domain-containing protein, partial [Candidatus Deferrimicrobiaceae bacterium]|nr:ASPIC/UnbV domain-containing protein [Candidatus Deferrimicrobiaceae bacterium]